MNRTYLFFGEEIKLTVHPHPIVLAKQALAPLAAIALLAGFPNQVTAIIFMLISVRFAWECALQRAHRYVLTNKRIIRESGIFNKKVVSLPLAKMTDLTYDKPLIGRLLGYGSLDLESAGQQDFGRIDFLPDSDPFYRTIMSLALGDSEVESKLNDDGA